MYLLMPRSKPNNFSDTLSSLPLLSPSSSDEAAQERISTHASAVVPLTRRSIKALNDVSNRRKSTPAEMGERTTQQSVVEMPLLPPRPRRSVRIQKIEQQRNQSNQQLTMGQVKAPTAKRAAKRKAPAAATNTSTATSRRQSKRIRKLDTKKTNAHDSLLDLGKAAVCPKVKSSYRQKRRRSVSRQSAAASVAKRSSDDKTKAPNTSRVVVAETPNNKLNASFALADYVDEESAGLVMAPFDRRNVGNVLEVPEVAATIYQYLYSIEIRFSADSYTDRHECLDDMDRSEIVDCLVQASMNWNCEPPVVFLAVQIMDRYVSLNTDIDWGDYIQVAAAAIWLASKYDEVAALDVCDLVKFCNLVFGRLHSRNDFINMESRILKALDFRISGPTSWSFLQRFLTVVNPQQSTKERAHYFLECSLYVEELLDYRPSAVAATVACLAIRNPKSEDIGPESMQKELLDYTPFSLKFVKKIAQIIEIRFVDMVPSKHEKREIHKLTLKERFYFEEMEKEYAAWVKYSRKEHGRVSEHCKPPKVSHLVG